VVNLKWGQSQANSQIAKKKTCAKRKNLFLWSSFLFQRKVVGKDLLKLLEETEDEWGIY